jgi:hypothetical protein
MKPINIIVGIGALAVAGLGGWYMYMQSQPLYQKAAQRGLDPALFPPTAASSAPAPVEPSAAPTAAPTAAAASVAPATTAP